MRAAALNEYEKKIHLYIYRKLDWWWCKDWKGLARGRVSKHCWEEMAAVDGVRSKCKHFFPSTWFMSIIFSQQLIFHLTHCRRTYTRTWTPKHSRIQPPSNVYIYEIYIVAVIICGWHFNRREILCELSLACLPVTLFVNEGDTCVAQCHNFWYDFHIFAKVMCEVSVCVRAQRSLTMFLMRHMK